MPRALTIAERGARAVATVAVLLAAPGCLYLLAGIRLGGPHVQDALPLDELPHRDAVPLLVFVLVWGVACAAIAWLLRPRGLGRAGAGVAVALVVFMWTYLTTALSVTTVRQIPAEDAFHEVATSRAVIVPTILGIFAGALLGRAGPAAGRRSEQMLSWLVACVGLVGLVDSVLPTHSTPLLRELVPAAVPFARVAAAAVSIALVYLSRPLGRGSRRAWTMTTVLLVGATALHVLHSDTGAIATAAVAALLVARRADFTALGDPAGRMRTLQLMIAAVLAAYDAGLVLMSAQDRVQGAPFRIGPALRTVSDTLVGLPGGLRAWEATAVLAVAATGVAAVLLRWLAPWRADAPHGPEGRDRALAIVREWGSDTLAPFVLRADKTYFFTRSGRSLVAYRVVAGVAVVSGDPLGPPEERDEVLEGFVRYARARGWRIAVLGASEGYVQEYRRRGLRCLYHGDEAVLDLERFSLDGRAIRKVRQSVARLERAGFTTEVVRARDVPLDTRSELAGVEAAWRGDEPVRGFAMAMDDLFRLEGDDAVFALGRGPDGVLGGFLHFAVSPAGAALSLSTMPRRHDTPNGFNEWLVCASVGWAREHGFRWMSLNFAPFAALLAPGAELRPVQRVERSLLRRTKGHFQLDNLLLFNRKFLPGWQRRFFVYERRTDLPRVGLAALAAEAYLPFGGRR